MILQLRGKKEVVSIKKEVRRGGVAQTHGTKENTMPAMVNKVGVMVSREKSWEWFAQKGCVNNNSLIHQSFAGIHGVWKDQPCYVVGAGPSLKEFLSTYGWSYLDGKHTIGINHTIEDYDGFEWFFFLDKRFLEKTTYDMSKYKGRIFAQCTTGLEPDNRTVTFWGKQDGPSKKMQDGLYSTNFSGLSSLNLAILTGANPIYLLGFGNGKGATDEAYHYKDDYNGEQKGAGRLEKFKRCYKGFENFSEYFSRIKHVTEGNDIGCFDKVRVSDLETKNKEISLKIIGRIPHIAHFSFTDDVAKHADITREIILRGYGRHTLHNINNPVIPVADLYVLEDFMSTKLKVNEFPCKYKAINIIHSNNCIPSPGFLANVALTKAWKTYFLDKYFIKNVEIIHGGIDLDPYKYVAPCNIEKVFGRITRWSPAKINQDWNRVCAEILEEIPDSQCLFYIDDAGGREKLTHARMVYNRECKIDMFKGAYLKNLSVYVHASGGFKETLSFAVIEAMATGLPIVYLSEGTGVLEEVTGSAGIRCETMDDVKKNIKILLLDKTKRKEYGIRSKEQAKKFDIKLFLQNFNALVKRCLNA